jgi:hypothetical protein
MATEPQPAVSGADRGLQDRLEKIAAKVIFLKCVLPEDALGNQVHFGFGLILGEIADEITAVTRAPESEADRLSPTT